MGAKIKEEAWNEVLTFIEQGLIVKQAYELAGISKASYFNKIKDDLNYLDAIKKAQQQFKLTHLNKITSKADKDWHASAWLLERIYPDEYAKVEKVENKEVDEFTGMEENEIDQEIEKLNNIAKN